MSVHSTNADRFSCTEFKEGEPKDAKPNVVVILNKGTDIQVYSGTIQSAEALTSWWETVDKTRYVVIGNFIFNPKEISAIGYIG